MLCIPNVYLKVRTFGCREWLVRISFRKGIFRRGERLVRVSFRKRVSGGGEGFIWVSLRKGVAVGVDILCGQRVSRGSIWRV